MYLIRLDDAAENMNYDNWCRIEKIFDKYSIKPFVGVIPHNEDKQLLKYEKIENFWDIVNRWKEKNWEVCMHGYNHVYSSKSGGINPINNRSEFAGNTYEMQKEKIIKADAIFQTKKINVQVFFAPSHTFDYNTLKALKENTSIKIISDTIANDIYFENGFYFIPQQLGRVRKMPFKITTFCYHPNVMTDKDFIELENFIRLNRKKIIDFSKIELKRRKRSLYDKFLKQIYFKIRRIKKIVVK